MSKINDGGPAFPHHFEDAGGHPRFLQSTGMTLRDWFAGQALAGMMDYACKAPMISDNQDGANKNLANSARLAYAFADAMIAQSQKQEPHDD